MNTIRTFIPSDSVASFKKFANKTKKNVEGFSYTIGEPYMKVFLHPVIEEGGMRSKRFILALYNNNFDVKRAIAEIKGDISNK